MPSLRLPEVMAIRCRKFHRVFGDIREVWGFVVRCGGGRRGKVEIGSSG